MWGPMSKIKQTKKSTEGSLVLKIICMVLLLWALLPINPYGYYILLKWICCPCFAYLAVVSFKNGQVPWIWIFGVSAGIYNPILTVHLGREIWSVVNIASIIILVVHAIKYRVNGINSQENHQEKANLN